MLNLGLFVIHSTYATRIGQAEVDGLSTIGARESRVALARESVRVRDTHAIDARIVGAEVGLASLAGEGRRTLARVAARAVRQRLVNARAAVQACGLIELTAVHGLIAAQTGVADRAHADPVVGAEVAGAVGARAALALVDEELAVGARVAGIARARVLAGVGHLLTRAVLAGRGEARIHVAVAVGAREERPTRARVAGKVAGERARGAVLARTARAKVDEGATRRARVLERTRARVAVDGAYAHAVGARRRRAVVDLHTAEETCVARVACALEAHARHACAHAVRARIVPLIRFFQAN